MFSLDSKVAVVTGASSGIGRAIAEGLAEAGATVVAVGRDAERTEQTRQTIVDAGGSCDAVTCDLLSDGAPAEVVRRAVDAHGSLDVVVPAAGVFAPEPFEETTLAAFDEQWQVNVRAPFALIKEAIEPLKRSSGSVVFVSSIAGHVGFPSSSAYCATKGAIEQLTKAMAVEFAGRGVRINAVAPGNVSTPMNAHLFEDEGYEAAMLAATPAGRIGEVEDIVPAVVFLASDSARYVHGVSLLVDGGWAAA